MGSRFTRRPMALHDRRYPGESDAYRTPRDQLLAAELALREQTENVAALRRKLPLGGPVPEDYVFEEGPRDYRDTQTVRDVRMSELFGDKPTLILVHFMFNPSKDLPCPMC